MFIGYIYVTYRMSILTGAMHISTAANFTGYGAASTIKGPSSGS